MLMRNDLDHEAVCVMGRDRIASLVREKRELVLLLRAMVNQAESYHEPAGSSLSGKARMDWGRLQYVARQRVLGDYVEPPVLSIEEDHPSPDRILAALMEIPPKIIVPEAERKTYPAQLEDSQDDLPRAGYCRSCACRACATARVAVDAADNAAWGTPDELDQGIGIAEDVERPSTETKADHGRSVGLQVAKFVYEEYGRRDRHYGYILAIQAAGAVVLLSEDREIEYARLPANASSAECRDVMRFIASGLVAGRQAGVVNVQQAVSRKLVDLFLEVGLDIRSL